MLEEFWEEIGMYWKIRELLDSLDPHLTPDYSKFTVVDGEEGDYGVISYSDHTGQLVAVKTVHGGDHEDVDFTEYGIAMMGGVVRSILENVIRSLPRLSEGE